MDKKLIIGVIAVVAIGGVLFYLGAKNKKAMDVAEGIRVAEGVAIDNEPIRGAIINPVTINQLQNAMFQPGVTREEIRTGVVPGRTENGQVDHLPTRFV